MHSVITRVSVYIARARGDQKKHARDRSLVHGARAALARELARVSTARLCMSKPLSSAQLR